MNFGFVQQRKKWFMLSGALVILSIGAIFSFGLTLGLDFTGGSLLEISYSDSRPAKTDIDTILHDGGYDSVRVQESGDNSFIIRLPDISEDEHQALLTSLRDQNTDQTITEDRFESFGPSLGQELRRDAIYAIITVLIAIILYIAYAFRKVSQPVASWKFGTIAVIALAHDTIIVVGLFAVLGYFFGTEVDSFFITALLTLLGFSVHDTIVTMDRVRENLIKHHDHSFHDIVNMSINQTVTRSINTSLTTLFTLVAIYLFGGASIRDLSLALIVGIFFGTYSSIFLAAPLLVTVNRLKRATN